MMNREEGDGPRLVLALVLSALILVGWYYFFDRTRYNYAPQEQNAKQQNVVHTNEACEEKEIEYVEVPKIKINSKELEGTISLRGARIDDLFLNAYKNTVDHDSGAVRLLAPSGDTKSYFTEFGWISSKVEVPSSNTIWHTDSEFLTPEKPIELHWKNSTGDLFKIKISVDENYMFFVEQSFTNNSDSTISIGGYGLVNKAFVFDKSGSSTVSHQGAVAAVEGSLEEYTYDKLKDDKIQKFDNKKIEWIGISDKYWLVSFIPDQEYVKGGAFQFADPKNVEKIQVDFVTKNVDTAAGQTFVMKHKMFAGAKQVKLLDKYAKEYNIGLFDRAIDFGWLYMITKPLFYALTFCYSLVGNFGVSILIITVIIKLLMFGLTNKSYRSMKKMKDLQPKIDQLKQQYANDKMKFNQKILELYKEEKVNPLSGILALLIQIPVFFAVYKVLYVTIEMRHAPFFGWIQDLSAQDPSNIFTLFGLLHIDIPSFMTLGAWPIIMSASMYFQQKMSPAPSDPAQAQVMKFLPLIFLFMFNSFPAGLLIYWTWSNILSMLQQKFFAQK